MLNRMIRAMLMYPYKVYALRKMQGDDRTSLYGMTLDIPKGVFHPAIFFSTKIFAGFLLRLDLQDKSLLEMGCGSGLLSLIAAERGSRVTSIDVNPIAVRTTERNAERNDLSKNISALQSDLFEALPHTLRFDVIIFNPPYYRKEPRSMDERAFFAGDALQTLRSFAHEARRFLAPNGSIYLLLSADVDEKEILGFFHAENFISTRRYAKRIFFERFHIYEFTNAD